MPLYAAVEGGGQSWRVAIAEDHPANIIHYEKINSNGVEPKKVLEDIKSFLEGHKYDALGIAAFGPIDTDSSSPTFGFILGTPNKPMWRNIDVVGYLWNRKVPCKFYTDVTAPAFAEYMYGKGRGGSCAYITVGTGVGAGFVINGKVVSGLFESECGHTPVRCRPGFVDESEIGACRLHKGGCVGGIAGANGISEITSFPRSQLSDIPDDHPVWDRVSHALGTLCYNISMYFAPQRIVLNGGVMQREILYTKTRRVVQNLGGCLISHPLLNEQIEDYIVCSTWGQNAGIVGALSVGQLAFEENYFFEDTARFRSLQVHRIASPYVVTCSVPETQYNNIISGIHGDCAVLDGQIPTTIQMEGPSIMKLELDTLQSTIPHYTCVPPENTNSPPKNCIHADLIVHSTVENQQSFAIGITPATDQALISTTLSEKDSLLHHTQPQNSDKEFQASLRFTLKSSNLIVILVILSFLSCLGLDFFLPKVFS